MTQERAKLEHFRCTIYGDIKSLFSLFNFYKIFTIVQTPHVAMFRPSFSTRPACTQQPGGLHGLSAALRGFVCTPFEEHFLTFC